MSEDAFSNFKNRKTERDELGSICIKLMGSPLQIFRIFLYHTYDNIISFVCHSTNVFSF